MNALVNSLLAAFGALVKSTHGVVKEIAGCRSKTRQGRVFVSCCYCCCRVLPYFRYGTYIRCLWCWCQRSSVASRERARFGLMELLMPGSKSVTSTADAIAFQSNGWCSVVWPSRQGRIPHPRAFHGETDIQR